MGVIYRKKFLSAPLAHQVQPQAEEESILGHFAGQRRFGGGSGSFSSFRPSFEGDD